MVVLDIVIKSVATFGWNGSIDKHSQSHTVEIITAYVRTAPAEEKLKSQESFCDSTALGDFCTDTECRGVEQVFMAHLSQQAGRRDSHCPPVKMDSSREDR